MTTFGLNTKIAAAENKVPDACVLLKKKQDCNSKILDIREKYFTTSAYSKFTNKIIESKLKEKRFSQ